MILVEKNMDQKAKKCSASLTELPRKIIYIYFYTLLLLVFQFMQLLPYEGSTELNF